MTTTDRPCHLSIAHVGNRTVDQHSRDLTIEEAREEYLHLDSKYRRVARLMPSGTARAGATPCVIFKWIDRADGNLPGVGTHFSLTIPADLLKD